MEEYKIKWQDWSPWIGASKYMERTEKFPENTIERQRTESGKMILITYNALLTGVGIIGLIKGLEKIAHNF